MRNVRRTTRPGAHEGVRRQVPPGFPVFSCRGGRCGPAVTGGVQPLPPAAGLPIRRRPGLSRRPSSACAAARPGAPAGHRTRPAGFVGDREHRQPPRLAQARPHAEDHPYRGPKDVQGVQQSPEGRGCFRPGGGGRYTSRPRLRIRSFCCSMFFCHSARVDASAPRPHATSPKPAALAHAARARRRRLAAQCPAPTAAWVTAGATGDTHPGIPEGRIRSYPGQPTDYADAAAALETLQAPVVTFRATCLDIMRSSWWKGNEGR